MGACSVGIFLDTDVAVSLVQIKILCGENDVGKYFIDAKLSKALAHFRSSLSLASTEVQCLGSICEN